ncbi:ABC transporter permease [Clostridium sp. SYSU_GA19001]|uniref:ABC transporter permease n=1 Tax=Clostridium caldaquaticum TaxID=2940653 RepID=UPI0020775D8A|nr:ABC transporter permease [Clostridium caldaquaticum]MCM8710014.1 ABC transporter permease [Clostridium caldaquaticum]
MKNIFISREMTILLLVVLLSVIISLNNITFLRIDNILDLLKSNTVLGIMALGMLMVILTGGIDVSVSATIAAVTVIVGKFMASFGGNIFVALLIGCVCGVLFGLLNGVLIAKLKIPPIVVTLGVMSIVNGAVLLYTNGAWINDIPESFINFGKITLFTVNTNNGKVGIPVQLLFLIGAALLTWFILKYTLIGRGIYAIGGNKVSAERIGYKPDLINIFLYGYMGLMVGVAGVVHTSIMQQVDPNAFIGFELQVISAVVLGGANILGGEGSVLGTILGVLFLAVMNNGLILMHIPVFWQKIVIGGVTLAAVSMDVIQRKRKEKTMLKVDVE